MIYIPEEWESKSQKQVMPLQIVEHRKLRPSKTFGGYTVLADGKITHAAMTTGPGNVMVAVVINDEDTDYGIVNQEITTFDDPLIVRRGDVIKIKVVASSGDSGNVTGACVSMLLELV